MLSKSALDFILHITNYFHGHWEDPGWGNLSESQLMIGLAIRKLASGLIDPEIERRVTSAVDGIVEKYSLQLSGRDGDTSLTDFVTSLANPEVFERFRQNPQEVLSKTQLSDEGKAILLGDFRGLLRVRGIQELERAGLSPLITDKFTSGLDLQIANMNINTNNFDTSNTTINTTVTTTITNHNDNTTTHTKHWPEAAIESVIAAIRYHGSQPTKERGALIVVGGGIKAIRDMTIGAEAEIRFADKVLYCVADPVTEKRIHDLNHTSESLYHLYGNDKPRIFTYKEMVETALRYVRQGFRVCLVFYGHPGMFAYSTHEAIRIARQEGYRAELNPGISTEATLFADLGIDPSQFGWQAFDSTELLINNRTIDASSHVLIWQPECAGDSGFNFSGYRKHNFPILIEHFMKFYPAEHPVIVYDASSYPHLPPQIQRLTVSTITKEHLSGISTLYLPPAKTPAIDSTMCKKMGLHIDSDERVTQRPD